MRTLFVAPFSPYPLVFGGAIRLYNLIQACRDFSSVGLLSFESWSESQADVESHLARLCDSVVFVPSAGPRQVIGRKAKSLLSPRSFQHLRYASPRFQEALDRELRHSRYDCVIVEMTPMAQYRFDAPGAVRILDLQNLEYELVRRRAAHGGLGPRRLALESEWRKLQREEVRSVQGFDTVFTPSEHEREILSALVPGQRIVTVPNTIDPDRFRAEPRNPSECHLTFVGATHVDANRDGVLWFARSVLPLIEERLPHVRFSIVGGDPPSAIRALADRPNIEVTGFVDDVGPYLASATLIVVPLRSGGGTRLKILEALAAGAPTVSTSVGAEGLDLRDGTEIAIADDPTAFADAVVQILSSPERQRQLGEAGREAVVRQYSWQSISARLQAEIEHARWARQSGS